mmetsp:Transcript_15286/g.57775  ORF Transcript_15286/g.57775 Transcript_15286/m.57775 type:complete len:252 (+) Transcript_15286:547-1302(+)
MVVVFSKSSMSALTDSCPAGDTWIASTPHAGTLDSISKDTVWPASPEVAVSTSPNRVPAGLFSATVADWSATTGGLLGGTTFTTTMPLNRCSFSPSDTVRSSSNVSPMAAVPGRAVFRDSCPVAESTSNSVLLPSRVKITEAPSGSNAGSTLPMWAPASKLVDTKRCTLPSASVRHCGASSTSVSSTTTSTGSDIFDVHPGLLGRSYARSNSTTLGLVSKSNLPPTLTASSPGTYPPAMEFLASKSSDPSA